MLVRDAAEGLEVFLLRRSARSAFAPDAYVFPGGTLDPADGSPEALARLRESRSRPEDDRIPAELPTNIPPVSEHERRCLLVTAARELLEESGIALLCDRAGLSAAADAVREEVAREASRFQTFLHERDLFIDGSRLHRFSHWITPPTEPRRYDTHFFLAAAPPDQTALADAAETHDGIWVSPSDALERNASASLHLVYPTIKHLERLRDFRHVIEALEYARTKAIVTIMPNVSPDEGFVMPESLEGAW